MGIKIKDSITVDGNKFKQMLKELAEKQVRVGFQKGAAKEDEGTDICDIAMWNELGTENMPSRPFLRKSVDENEEKITEFLQDSVKKVLMGNSAEQVLKEIGIFQKDLIQEKIIEGDFVPNANSTIKKKKSTKPLIDTGRMRQSVNYVIKKKGTED